MTNKTEKKPTHTPGPRWARAKDGGDIVEIMGASNEIIGTAIDGETAQLWISAPDLLEASKILNTELHKFMLAKKRVANEEIMNAIFGLRAAIAKTEGK